MDSKRRIKLFMTGVLLGVIIMYFFIFKDRNIFKSPKEVIREKLQTGKLSYTDKTTCQMKCYNISSSDIDWLIKAGEIEYYKVHEKPCAIYALQGKKDREIRIEFTQCDSINRIISAADISIKKDTCDCK